MTVEEAYAAPVALRRRKGRTFVIGLIVGIAAGAVATLLLNRAAEAGEATDEEPVVELQPALAGDTATVTRLPAVPLTGTMGVRVSDANGASAASTRAASEPAASRTLPPVAPTVPVKPAIETERPA